MLPVLFSSAYFTLYAYPLFMGLAWGVGFFLTQHLFQKYQINQDGLLQLFLGIFISAWLGAKLLFLLVSAGDKSTEYFSADYFWLGGGFVFYGGLIFALAFYLIYSLFLKKFNFQHTRLLAPGLAFGHAVGRVGCFLTGCCFGVQCNLPWAVENQGEHVHPTQLYEAAVLFILGGLALRWIKKERTNFYVITQYLLIYSVARFFIEYFRGDTLRGQYWSILSTSQFISLVMFVTILLFRIRKK